jgi:MFS family permease
MAPWLAAAGAFVVSLDSMMNIAFPSIAATFHVPPDMIRWVIICYTGVYAVTAFVGGAVADLVGHLRVFRLGAILTAASLLAGAISPTFEWMLVTRGIQGVAGGLVYGTAPGIATLGVAPDQRGRALGIFTGAMALGLAVGPWPAGVLVDAFGWPAVYYVRVPASLGLFVWALFLPGLLAADGVRRFVRLTDIRRQPVPLACVLAFLSYAAIFSIWLLGPFYLVERRGFSATVGGVMFALTPLGMTLAAPFAGRAADRMGPAVPMIFGLALEAAGLALLAWADASVPVTVVVAALFGAGLGLGTFQVPMLTMIMNAFPPALQGAAGGLTFLSRTTGLVTGVAVLASLFKAREAVLGFDAAFRDAMLLASGFVVAAAVLAAIILRPPSKE